MNSRTRSSKRNEVGAQLVEYSLLLALIVIVCIVAVAFFGNELLAKFGEINSAIP